ncbi:MAG: electron transfer flavoprotein subunit alpha/FixB family protein [Promethearchaeota archaeon]
MVVERAGDQVAPVAFQLLAEAKRLAGHFREPVAAVLLGRGLRHLVGQLASAGADVVYCVDSELLDAYHVVAYAKTISDLVRRFDPRVVLFGATRLGSDLAPRVAKRLEAGLTADCTKFEVDPEGNLVQIKPAFGGNLMAKVITTGRPAMATVRPGIFPTPVLEKANEAAGVEVVDVNVGVSARDALVKVVRKVRREAAPPDLETAEVIVAGGRGMGSAEAFCTLERLATALGGVVGATRGAVEAGLAPKDIQIGVTGKVVSPRVYVACGISGASQHVAGVRRPEFVVAVNKDPDAPIFNVAHLGVVADVHEFIPALLRALEKN